MQSGPWGNLPREAKDKAKNNPVELVKLLKDKDDDVRMQAVRRSAIAVNGHGEHHEAVLPLLKDPKHTRAGRRGDALAHLFLPDRFERSSRRGTDFMRKDRHAMPICVMPR